MPNIRSAAKRVRQTKVRTVRNRAAKARYKTIRKQVRAAVAEGNKSEAETQLKLFASAVDKAAKTNVIHRNAASRYKSALAKKVGALS